MIKKTILTIVLLVISNTFMTFAWYGHLKFKELGVFSKLGIFGVIFISWGIALFEYMFQVPANRIGFVGNGGPFNLWQLKVIQEAITLTVFTLFTEFPEKKTVTYHFRMTAADRRFGADMELQNIVWKNEK